MTRASMRPGRGCLGSCANLSMPPRHRLSTPSCATAVLLLAVLGCGRTKGAVEGGGPSSGGAGAEPQMGGAGASGEGGAGAGGATGEGGAGGASIDASVVEAGATTATDAATEAHAHGSSEGCGPCSGTCQGRR